MLMAHKQCVPDGIEMCVKCSSAVWMLFIENILPHTCVCVCARRLILLNNHSAGNFNFQTKKNSNRACAMYAYNGLENI